jgi:hypothetical protein
MRMGYILIASAALGITVMVTPVVQAATFGGAGARPATDNLAIVVKEGQKSQKSQKRMNKEHHGERGCGAFMYRKGGKCVDARNK